MGRAQDTDKKLPAPHSAKAWRYSGHSDVPGHAGSSSRWDNFPVSFVITATADPERILEFAQELQGKAMQAHMFQFSDIDTKIDQPQSEIFFDHDKVASMGLDMQKVGSDMSAAIGGNYVNWFNIAGRSYKVIPQIKRIDRLNPEQLENIYVT